MPTQYTNDINQPWVDLEKITDTHPQRNRLASLLLNELIHTLQLFNKEGLTPFLNTWRQLDYLIGKSVTLHTSTGTIHGVMKNISDKGGLILLSSNNQEKCYLTGEISVRASKKEGTC